MARKLGVRSTGRVRKNCARCKRQAEIETAAGLCSACESERRSRAVSADEERRRQIEEETDAFVAAVRGEVLP